MRDKNENVIILTESIIRSLVTEAVECMYGAPAKSRLIKNLLGEGARISDFNKVSQNCLECMYSLGYRKTGNGRCVINDKEYIFKPREFHYGYDDLCKTLQRNPTYAEFLEWLDKNYSVDNAKKKKRGLFGWF